MEGRSYYQYLGVARGATQDEIKAAYRRMSAAYHPDNNNGTADAEMFARVQDAYSVLGDPETRARFDRGEAVGPRQSEQARQARLLEKAVVTFERAIMDPAMEDPTRTDVVAFAQGLIQGEFDEALRRSVKAQQQLDARKALSGRALHFGERAEHVETMFQRLIAEAEERLATLKEGMQALAELKTHLRDYTWIIDGMLSRSEEPAAFLLANLAGQSAGQAPPEDEQPF